MFWGQEDWIQEWIEGKLWGSWEGSLLITTEYAASLASHSVEIMVVLSWFKF